MRIRTIKPEFWSDGKISRLSDGAALFFIGLWNLADDEGKLRADIDTICNRLPRFNRRTAKMHLISLLNENLIFMSTSEQLVSNVVATSEQLVSNVVATSEQLWCNVRAWHHQRISKPILPKIKASDLNEIIHCVPQFGKEEYTWDRKGKERNYVGKERKLTRASQDRNRELPAGQAVGIKIWETYLEAFKNRYGVSPVRNAKTNSQCKQLGIRLGEIACEVTRFYLSHNDPWFLKTQHSLDALLKNAESLATQWQRGVAVTSADVRAAEKALGNDRLMRYVHQNFGTGDQNESK